MNEDEWFRDRMQRQIILWIFSSTWEIIATISELSFINLQTGKGLQKSVQVKIGKIYVKTLLYD